MPKPSPARCRRRCSFAVVIQQLPESMRDAVCVFYLVLRALDTVEDDMRLDPKVKIPLLRCFHEKSYDRCGGLQGDVAGRGLLGASQPCWPSCWCGEGDGQLQLCSGSSSHQLFPGCSPHHTNSNLLLQELENDVRRWRVRAADGELPAGHRWVGIGAGRGQLHEDAGRAGGWQGQEGVAAALGWASRHAESSAAPLLLPAAADVFLGLDSEYQRVIADICKKMGAGMADFVPKDSKRSSSEVGGSGSGSGSGTGSGRLVLPVCGR